MHAYHSLSDTVMSRDSNHSRLLLGELVLGLAAALALACVAAPSSATGKTVRIPLPSGPGTLTPLTFALGYPLLTLVYDTVTWRDPAGVPRPWLARSVQVTDAGRRVVVRLRDGVRWHDGRPLVAGDVAFTYELMRERRHPRFAPQLRAIASVRATGRRTVEFHLRHPSLGFADQPLADVPIVPAHLWRGLAPGLRAPAGPPVGSGPYRYDGHRPDGGVRLVAVPSYFRGRPRAEAIETPIVPQLGQMIDELRRGTVDLLPISLTPRQRASLESISIRVAEGPLYLGTMLIFNVRRGPFRLASVRREISRVLDPDRIARAAGRGVPATTGMIHPRSRWAPTTVERPRTTTGRPLAALGLAPLRVLAPANDEARLEAGRQVVLALRRAGARARLVTLSRERLGRAVGEGGRHASFELAIWSIPALASHDPDYLAAMFGSDGRLNRSGYRSREFDQLVTEVAAAPSRTSRRSAVGELLARLARDAPAVPLLFAGGAFGYRSTSPVGWTFAAGSGIVDKQSLLRAAPRRSAVTRPPPAMAGEGGGGPGLFGVLGAGMLATAALLAAAVALTRRR